VEKGVLEKKDIGLVSKERERERMELDRNGLILIDIPLEGGGAPYMELETNNASNGTVPAANNRKVDPPYATNYSRACHMHSLTILILYQDSLPP